MSYACLSPSWFFGYDIALEMIFAVISILIASFALKIYRKTDQRQIKLFSAAFLSIGISYIIESILNYLIISNANESICRAVNIESIELFNALAAYVHMFFMTVGLVLLVYLTFRIENKKLLLLLLITSLLLVFLSTNPVYAFYLASSIYLIFISWYYISNYRKSRQSQTLLVAVAFIFLLFGTIHFLISVNHQLFYVLGHVLELLAYVFILANLYMVLRK